MLALDTNVLARFVLRDDELQFQRASAALASARVFVATTVLLETAWMLQKVYRLPKAEVLAALDALVSLPNLEVDRRPSVERALQWAADGMDVADAFHLAHSEAADGFLTFDQPLMRCALRLRALPKVSEP